jgi:hypothetical protein
MRRERSGVAFATTMSAGALIAATVWLVGVPANAQGLVLYDQMDSASGQASVSDDYSNANSLDEQIADDFTVPAGESWEISQVDVLGSAPSGNPPSTVNVFIYSNAGGLPGAQSFSQTGIAATGGPNYSIPLTAAPVLVPGTYWISVQQAEAVESTAVWYWNDRDAQSGNPAAYRNTGGGRVPSCLDWGIKYVCLENEPPIYPDQNFKLSGTSAPYVPPAPPPAGTTNPPPAGDVDAPQTTITKRPANRTEKSTAKFRFRSDEAGSTFECKLDRKPWKPCSSPKSFKRLTEGVHTFKVRAIDPAGNVDSSPAKDKFRVTG